MTVDSYGNYKESFYWEEEDNDTCMADYGTNNLNCIEHANCKKPEKNHFCSTQNQPEYHQGSKPCRRKKKSNDIFERSEPACPLIQSGAVDFCCGIPATTPIVFSELISQSPGEHALPPPPKIPESKGTACEEALLCRRYQPEEEILGEHDFNAITVHQKSKQARRDLVELAQLGGKCYPGIVRLLEMITKSAKTEIEQAKRQAKTAMNRTAKESNLGKRRVVSCPEKRILKSPAPEGYPMGNEKAPPEYEMYDSPEPCSSSKGYGNRIMKNRSGNESYEDYLQSAMWQKPPIPCGSSSSTKKTYPVPKPCTSFQTRTPPASAQCPIIKSFTDVCSGNEIFKTAHRLKQPREMSCPPCQYQAFKNEYDQQQSCSDPPQCSCPMNANQPANLKESPCLAVQFHQSSPLRSGEAYLKPPSGYPRLKPQNVGRKNPPGYNMNSQIVANQPSEERGQPLTQDSMHQYDLVYKKLFDDTVSALQNRPFEESQESASAWENINHNNYIGSSSLY